MQSLISNVIHHLCIGLAWGIRFIKRNGMNKKSK